MTRRLTRLLGLVVLAVGWNLASRHANTPLMPGVGGVIDGVVNILRSPDGLGHIRASVGRVWIGLGLASVVGTVLGVVMARSRFLLDVMTPAREVARSTAGLAVYPLIIVFLGLGESSKVFLVFWGAWPPILLNTIYGLQQVAASSREAAVLDGAEGLRLLWFIDLPLASPAILTGIRIAAGIGWIGVVAAEMIVGSSGLGYLVLINSQLFRYEEAYASVLLISACGLATHTVLSGVQRAIDRRVHS